MIVRPWNELKWVSRLLIPKDQKMQWRKEQTPLSGDSKSFSFFLLIPLPPPPLSVSPSSSPSLSLCFLCPWASLSLSLSLTCSLSNSVNKWQVDWFPSLHLSSSRVGCHVSIRVVTIIAENISLEEALLTSHRHRKENSDLLLSSREILSRNRVDQRRSNTTDGSIESTDGIFFAEINGLLSVELVTREGCWFSSCRDAEVPCKRGKKEALNKITRFSRLA